MTTTNDHDGFSQESTRASPTGPSTTARGRAFESTAACFLERLGFVVVGRNVRTAGGELDIVAWDDKVLVFVEVRARARRGALGAAQSVTPKKQARVARAAGAYLAEHSVAGPTPRCRFDVVLRDGDELQHIRDAFRMTGDN